MKSWELSNGYFHFVLPLINAHPLLYKWLAALLEQPIEKTF